jgi:hypothetical protein
VVWFKLWWVAVALELPEPAACSEAACAFAVCVVGALCSIVCD